MNQNIYNESGAVTDLFRKLKNKSIYFFHSLEEIFDYKRNFQSKIDNIKQEFKNEINENINNLNNENEILLDEYNRCKKEQEVLISNEINELNKIIQNAKNNVFSKIKIFFIKRKLNNLEANYNTIIEQPLKKYLIKIDDNKTKLDYLTNHQDEEIYKRARTSINEIEYIISELNALSPLIYGCVGELKAINLFKKLPNQYYVINDFRQSFQPPLYNRNEDDKIFSIQLDHIIIGPTGVYLIETKYWNEKSVKSNEIFSPIKQVKRGGFALFIIINDYTKGARLFSTNWGTTKISVSNILLMMNSTTNDQFQYVKILTESNFIDYIIRRPIILNEEQIKYLVNVLK